MIASAAALALALVRRLSGAQGPLEAPQDRIAH
jgi:hypothetical protein